MTSFVDLVMEAAAFEMLSNEAAQIDQEVQLLLAKMEHAPVKGLDHGVFLGRFMELLERRGEVCRKSLILARRSESRRHAPDDQRENAGMKVNSDTGTALMLAVGQK